MTREDEKLKAEEKHQEELRKIDAKYAVLDMLGDVWKGYKEPFVHHSKLWGSTISVHFNRERYSYGSNAGRSPDADLLRKLLRAYPPMPMIKVSGGGLTSFKPDTVDNNAEAEKRNDKVYDCHGVIVELDPANYASHAKVKWYCVIDEEEETIWTFEVEFPLWNNKLGTLDIKYNYYGGHGSGEVSSVERCVFTPKGEAQSVRFSAGDRKTPNRFVVFWSRLHGSQVDFHDLFTMQTFGH